ncbi:hypothetical protein Q1695_001335 [Nippostrongylus brasiliensis]|nr:hypothetical protein Q1695_001335 [Nippostrongylus brasiliensis]
MEKHNDCETITIDNEMDKCRTVFLEGAVKNQYDKARCLSRRQRIIVRNRTERLSELLDWKTLATFYRDARRKALTIAYKGLEECLAKASSVPATPSISCPTTPHESDYLENSELEDYEEKQRHEN